MAALRAPSPSFLSAFLSVARAQLLPQQPAVQRITLRHRIEQLRLHASILPAALAPIPSLLGDLWDGLLKAVPKKKTSHSKKRSRLLAGKALKDVTALNKCSACGRTKRAHVLCPYCVKSMRIYNVQGIDELTDMYGAGIKQWFGNGFKTKQEVEAQKQEQFQRWNEELQERGQTALNWEDLYEVKKDAKKESGI